MALTSQQAIDWLVQQGVDPNVAQQEGSYVAGQYADPDENAQQVLEQSLGSYLQRSRSGGDRDEGGYDTRHDDPAVTTPFGTTPARTDSPWDTFPDGTPSGGAGGGAGSGGGGRRQFGSGDPRDLFSPSDLQALHTLFGQVNREPGREFNLPLPGELPAIEVPGVNLSLDIDNALLSILRGEDTTTQETDSAISRLLGSLDPAEREERLTKRQLQATETAQLAQQGLLDSLRSQLADAGVVGLPGVSQGPETAGARRVTERVAIPFAQQLRENAIEESELADQRELQALQLATGWSGDKATRVLQAAAAGTDRQRVLSEIALGTLDRNIVWNQFLADFGLRREELAADIQAGRLDRVNNVMTNFLAFLAQLRGGFIGRD